MRDDAEARVEAAKQRYISGEIDAEGLDRAVEAALSEPAIPLPSPLEDREPPLEAYPPRGPLPERLVAVVDRKPPRRVRKPDWYDTYAAWRAEQPD